MVSACRGEEEGMGGNGREWEGLRIKKKCRICNSYGVDEGREDEGEVTREWGGVGNGGNVRFL